MPATFTATTVTSPSGAQGSYPQRLIVGHEGMVADLQSYVTRSYRNQSGAALPYGVLCMTDNSPSSNDPYAIEIATGATNIVGLAIDTLTMEGTNLGTNTYTPNPTPFYSDGRPGYADGQTVNILSKGVVWVYATEAIALGNAVRFWDTAYSGTVTGAFLGRFCTTASGTRTTAITGGARWLSETSAAGLVLLEIDIPSATFTADT